MNGKTDDGSLRPSDFLLGSLRSRAAARASVEHRIRSFIRLKIIHVGCSGSKKFRPMQRLRSGDDILEIVHVGCNETARGDRFRKSGPLSPLVG